MGMRIKQYTFSDTTALKEHLRAAEAQIDALSDEELDQLEAKHEMAIASFLSSNNRSQILPFHSRHNSSLKKSSIRRNSTVVSVVLMSALTLFILKVKEDDTVGQWTPKGLSSSFSSSSSSSVCEISVLQNDKRIVLGSSSGFVVQSLTKIYLFTNCKGSVTIQSLERGIWVDKGFAESQKGLLVDEDGFVDFRNYLGEELRLKVANGISEEFSLVTRP